MEIQRESIQRLDQSLQAILAVADEAFAERADAVLARVDLLLGRWFCACAERYPEELRLFAMIMSRQASALDPDDGHRIFPVAMQLLAKAVAVIEAAQHAGALDDGSAVDRAVIWASGLSGVLQTDDLEQYSPELFGHSRLALQANHDLIRGWGADRDPARGGPASWSTTSAAADQLAP